MNSEGFFLKAEISSSELHTLESNAKARLKSHFSFIAPNSLLANRSHPYWRLVANRQVDQGASGTFHLSRCSSYCIANALQLALVVAHVGLGTARTGGGVSMLTGWPLANSAITWPSLIRCAVVCGRCVVNWTPSKWMISLSKGDRFICRNRWPLLAVCCPLPRGGYWSITAIPHTDNLSPKSDHNPNEQSDIRRNKPPRIPHPQTATTRLQ